MGLEELSPKKDGRSRTEGASPVNSGMNVSGCSTTTQSASVHQQRRKNAIPQNIRPSRRRPKKCSFPSAYGQERRDVANVVHARGV
eukprot:2539681-Pleurochrysis_carterae.AAC.1